MILLYRAFDVVDDEDALEAKSASGCSDSTVGWLFRNLLHKNLRTWGTASMTADAIAILIRRLFPMTDRGGLEKGGRKREERERFGTKVKP